MPDDPYKYFRIEARELLDELIKGALELDKGGSPAEAGARILRHAHTLKGAARVVKQPQIADHAHAIEDVLDPFRESQLPMPRERLETVLALLDAISAKLATLPPPGRSADRLHDADSPSAGSAFNASDGTMNGSGPAHRSLSDVPIRLIRAEIAEMDALLDGVGEAHARLGALQGQLDSVERARELATIVASQLALPRGQHRGLDPGYRESPHRTERARKAAGELLGTISAFQQGLQDDFDQLDRELGDIRDGVEGLRLVPAESLFTDLERAARDAARTQLKLLVFECSGGGVRLDGHLLTSAQNALQQIVRNAVVHGIEPESERRALGKKPAGLVSIDISRRGRNVVFRCRDDGRGIDLSAVRVAAERKGLLAASVSTSPASELMAILLKGGLTTSGSVTELSGRGIGLDVVRDFASRFGGEVTVQTEAGRGTTVELEVPLSLAAFEVLKVESEQTKALIPLEAIVRTLRVGSEQIQINPQGQTLIYEGTVLSFVRLGETFSGRTDTKQLPGACSVAIISAAGGMAALGVDRLLGTSSVVVRPLPNFVPTSPLIAGVWLNEDGRPELVVDANGIVADAQRNRQPSIANRQDAAPMPILVIDDSLTTRMLEQSILESAGYRVEVASSAEEGLIKARTRPYLLFLVDVEMPGMDGFAFISHVRADSTLRDTPAILVTSRAAPEDLQRGFDAGASAYVTKGEFDQGKLLQRIKELTVHSSG